MKRLFLFAILLFVFLWASGRSPLQAQGDKTASPIKDQTAVLALISKLKFDEAEIICKKTIKEQPENMTAFTELISIYTKTGRFDEALFAIEEIKDLKADPNLLHLLTGKIYLAQGKFADAKKEFEAINDKTFQYYPDKQGPAGELINSAAADINKNDLAGAKEKLAKALSADPYNIDAYYNTAVLNYLEGKYDDSIKTLYKITDTKVFYPYAGYLTAKNLIALGRADEAQLLLNKSIKEYPPLFESYIELANLNIKAGEYQKAETYLQKAAELMPDMHNLHSLQILYGTLYFRQGKIKEAIASFESALKNTDKINPDIYYNLAVCYELNKDNKNSLKHYNEYLKSNPKDAKEIEGKIKKLEH